MLETITQTVTHDPLFRVYTGIFFPRKSLISSIGLLTNNRQLYFFLVNYYDHSYFYLFKISIRRCSPVFHFLLEFCTKCSDYIKTKEWINSDLPSGVETVPALLIFVFHIAGVVGAGLRSGVGGWAGGRGTMAWPTCPPCWMWSEFEP